MLPVKLYRNGVRLSPASYSLQKVTGNIVLSFVLYQGGAEVNPKVIYRPYSVYGFKPRLFITRLYR